MKSNNPRDSKTPRGYLKYWRVIRQYYKAKHGVSQSDLDVLLFMYDEGYFGRDRFDEYARITGWDQPRFYRMLNAGWFEVFRKANGNKKAIYRMTEKGKLLCADIYRKLNGEDIPMALCNNPMVARKARYSDKIYLDMIREMNEFNRQQRRQSRE